MGMGDSKLINYNAITTATKKGNELNNFLQIKQVKRNFLNNSA
jgi:hypothetical protein